MKKCFFMMACIFMCACETADFDNEKSGNVTLSFVPTSSDISRSTVNIGDYFSRLAVQLFDADGNKVFSQVRTQSRDDSNYGTLNCQLSPGTYTVVAVGHSSPVTPTIKSPEMVQFTSKDGVKNSDTFCYCGTVTICDDSGMHELIMNRMTAMLRFHFTDTTIPENFAKLKIDYSGGSANFNPTTSEGCTKSNQSELRNRSTEYQVFTFPYLSTSSKLKVTLSALDADGTILSQKTITDVPATRNRISTYTGTLFDGSPGSVAETGFGLTVNDEWDGEDFYQFSRMTFNVCGDFTLNTHEFTRALEADGKTMTDVWVLDYVGGELKQQLHQTSDDADFGSPTLDLTIGTHHLYFIASRGAGAVLNTTTHALTFTSVRDTFWKDYEVTIIGGTSSGNRSVTLDRIVTKLKLTFTDAIPEGAATFNVTPSAWYYGVDYTTGEPPEATANGTITVNIPTSEIWVVNEAVSIFGFSSATEWTTNIAINCKAANNDVLGSATIASAPFVRNRVSEYTGPLFTAGGGMTLSLNTEWDESYQGTW